MSLVQRLRGLSITHRAITAASIRCLSDLMQLRNSWNPNPSFDSKIMTDFLDDHNQDLHAKMRHFLSTDKSFIPQYNLSLEDERELALQRLKALCDKKFISVHFFSTNPTAIFAAHENTSIVDGATATKMTVQFNLFGGKYGFSFILRKH